LNFIISDILCNVESNSFNRCKGEIFAPHLDPLGRAGFDHWIIHISLTALCVSWFVRGMHARYWWESLKERDHWEDQDVDGWTTLKWILER
jgi:hypothetical protein